MCEMSCLKRVKVRRAAGAAKGRLGIRVPAGVAAVLLACVACLFFGGSESAGAQQRKTPHLRRSIEEGRRLKVVGRYEEAEELFRSLYESYPDNEIVIRGLGETLLKSKKYGEAEEFYLEVREWDGGASAYARELEQIHMLQGRYRDAAGDCMDILADEPVSIDWIRGELVRIGGAADEGIDLVLDVLSERAAAESSQHHFEMLAIEMLSRAARREEAASRLDAQEEDGEMSAEHLYPLAIRLDSLGDADNAIKALRLSLKREGTIGAASGAAFKLSELLVDAGRPEESRAVLEDLSARYPNTPLAFKAQLELASLEAKALGRPERALALYEDLLSQESLPIKENEVKEAIAYCLMRVGRLAEARERFTEIASGKTEPAPHAMFMAAEVSFFMGETDSAMSLYADLAGGHPEWDEANDALARMFLLQECAGAGAEPLALYATAELLGSIDRPDSALTYLSSIIESHPDSPLVDDAMFRAGELHLELGDADRALAMCRSVVEHDPEGRLAPLAQERIGDIWWEERGDGRRALDEYTKGLDSYPNSLVAPRVRDKVSRLRREVG